jgi:dTDP-4-amino-4,6-dideoxygalactose transaminase
LDKILHVGSPQMGSVDKFVGLVRDIFDKNWFTNNGPYVQALEEQICKFLGVKHCVAVVNGTTGLQIAAKACGVTNDVVVPAFTFCATAHAYKWMGYNVHLCDIGLDHHINYGKLEEYLYQHPEIQAIVPVHIWGVPCDINGLTSIAKEHKVKLIYDAAHAFGSVYKDVMIGNFGDCEVFSFHATKIFNTFEGGAITTNNDKIAKRARELRNFGFTSQDEIGGLGINGKMHEISAAMGLINLERMPKVLVFHLYNYSLYKNRLQDTVAGIQLYQYPEGDKSNHAYMIIEIDSTYRDRTIEALVKEDILARRYFSPGLHRVAPYNAIYNSLWITDMISSRIIVLPTGLSVQKRHIDRICDIIERTMEGGL